MWTAEVVNDDEVDDDDRENDDDDEDDEDGDDDGEDAIVDVMDSPRLCDGYGPLRDELYAADDCEDVAIDNDDNNDDNDDDDGTRCFPSSPISTTDDVSFPVWPRHRRR